MILLIVLFGLIFTYIFFCNTNLYRETFDTRATSAFHQYNPLAAFIVAVRRTESKKHPIYRFNLRSIFNKFTEDNLESLSSVKCDMILLRQFIKNIEKQIPTYELIFTEDLTQSKCYKYKYAKDITFVHIHCIIINKDLQTSNYLEQGNITKLPVDLYAAIHKNNDVIFTSVNGYKIESDIPRYANPDSKNYYYPAQLLNSNIDDTSQFGGYSLLTPDSETLKKFCEQRRKEINEYSYCKLNKLNNDGTKTISYDQTVDEINCVAKGGEIIRTKTPKFGLLFDNLDSITENINGNIEINDMYIGESDICADLTRDHEIDNQLNRTFNAERKHNKIVTNYLK